MLGNAGYVTLSPTDPTRYVESSIVAYGGELEVEAEQLA